jgi:hypothetical protein
MDFHYGYDLASKEFSYTPTTGLPGASLNRRDVIYRRQMFSLVVGYKFGFINRPDWRKRQAE